MPKTRAHTNKLARAAQARRGSAAIHDIAAAHPDPVKRARFEKLFARLEAAKHKGAASFDELWELALTILEAGLYVYGGFKSEADFLKRALQTDPRTAKRNMRVAKYASPKDEETYGVTNIDAAIDYLEAVHGPLARTLPVAFDRLRIPVVDGGGAHTERVAFKDLTAVEIQRATRLLKSKGKRAEPEARARVAFEAALAKHPAFKRVRVSARAGLATFQDVPIASIGVFAKVIAATKTPVDAPAKSAKRH
jgi:hypothetical protein